MSEYTFLEQLSTEKILPDSELTNNALIDNYLVDSHCHFDFEVFDAERTELWELCRKQNIRHLLIPGVHPEQWSKAYAITQEQAGIVMAAGVHPWWVHQVREKCPSDASANAGGLCSEQQLLLQEYLQKPQCVAVGECGLDKKIDTPLELQTVFFEQQVKLAAELILPLIIHVRNTHNETIKILSHYRPSAGGVIHGFTGSLELAEQYWKLGFYLGVGGSITYARANKTRKTVASMSLDSLLLETDAPDMPLYGYQGRPNNPMHVINVADALVKLRNENIEKVAQATTANFKKLFQLSY